MFIKKVLLLGCAGAIAWHSQCLAGAEMKEGLWEITAQMEMPGMPFAMPPLVWQQCMSSEEMVPVNSQQGGGAEDCSMESYQVSKGTVKWVMTCASEEGPMRSSGQITYHGTSFSGSSQVQGAGMPGVVSQKMSGRRLGSCPH